MDADAMIAGMHDDFIASLDRQAERHDMSAHGVRVAWRRFGSGPPLVLLHGGHGSWLHWVRNIRPLAERYSVWVPDLPGYGDSDEVADFEQLLAVTQGTLDTLLGASTPIELGGFSFGGLVAGHIAARRGQLVRLSLFGPGGHGGTRRPRGELRQWRSAWERHDASALEAVMRHNLLMHMLYAEASVDALALRIHTDACVRTRFRSKAISRAGALGTQLAAYQGPLLLAWGEHDVTAVPPEVVEKLSRPDAQAHIVPGAGHWVQYERADVVNRLLLATP